MIEFQLLSYAFSIAVDAQAVTERLKYLTEVPPQDLAPSDSCHWEVRGQGPFTIIENGDALAEVSTPDDVLYIVYQRAHWRVHERMTLSGWRAVHAATLTIDGNRVALVGSKGAGKSTLACAALVAGVQVHGDEVVFVCDGQSLPHPRPFHVKPGTFAVVDGLPMQEDLPITGAGEQAVWALEPTRHGWQRAITVAPLDVVILVQPTRAEQPEVHPIDTGAALPRLVAELFTNSEPAVDRLRDATNLLATTQVLDLAPGTPADTIGLLVDSLKSS